MRRPVLTDNGRIVAGSLIVAGILIAIFAAFGVCVP
jgi:hypothetical protein